VADNTVFADTLLTVSAKCPAHHTWMGKVCVCEAGRTMVDNGGFLDASDPTQAAKIFSNQPGGACEASTDGCSLCMACPTGMTSTPVTDNTHACERCPIGKYGGAIDEAGAYLTTGIGFWTSTNADTRLERQNGFTVAATDGAGTCVSCDAGRFGVEHPVDGQTTTAADGIVFGSGELNTQAKAQTAFCTKCPVGTYQPSTGQANDDSCIGCGVGEFVLMEAAVGATKHVEVCTTMCTAISAGSGSMAVYGLYGIETEGLKLKDASRDYTTASFTETDDGSAAPKRLENMDRCVASCTDANGNALNGRTPIKDPITKMCVDTCTYLPGKATLADGVVATLQNSCDNSIALVNNALTPRTCAHKGLQEGFEGATAKLVSASITTVNTIPATAHGFENDDKVYYMAGVHDSASIKTGTCVAKVVGDTALCAAVNALATDYLTDDANCKAVTGSKCTYKLAELSQGVEYTVKDKTTDTFKLHLKQQSDSDLTSRIAIPKQPAYGAYFGKKGTVTRQCVSKVCGVNERANVGVANSCSTCSAGFGRWVETSTFTCGGPGDGVGAAQPCANKASWNSLVFAHAHQFQVDDPVQYRANGKRAIDALVEGQTYYVMPVWSDNTMTSIENDRLVKLSLVPSWHAAAKEITLGVNSGAAGNQITRDGAGDHIYAQSLDSSLITLVGPVAITNANPMELYVPNNFAQGELLRIEASDQVNIIGALCYVGKGSTATSVTCFTTAALDVGFDSTKPLAGRARPGLTVGAPYGPPMFKDATSGSIRVIGTGALTNGADAILQGKNKPAGPVTALPAASLNSVAQDNAFLTTGAVAANKITATAHIFEAGDKVRYEPNTGLPITGLTAGATYNVWSKASANGFSLSKMPASMGGTQITGLLGGSANNAFFLQGNVERFKTTKLASQCQTSKCSATEHVKDHRCHACATGKVSKCVAKILGSPVATGSFTPLADAAVHADVATARKAYVGSPITGISRANPAVVTAAAHGFANGDVVVLTNLKGMHEMNGLPCLVGGKTDNTFQCTGVDSSNFEVFSGDSTTNVGVAIPLRAAAKIVKLAAAIDANGAATLATDNECDDTGMADGQCYDIVCPVNFYNLNNECVACGPYTTHVGGTKAADSDSLPITGTAAFCHHILCPANFYRSASAGCAACPTGKFVAAGGDDGVAEASASVCQASTCSAAAPALNPWTSACEACPAWLETTTQYSTLNTAASNLANEIDTAAAHSFVTGDQVLYTQGAAGTAITGLASGTKYYVLIDPATPTKLKLSSTAGIIVTDVSKHATVPVVVTATAHGFRNGDVVAFNKGNLDTGTMDDTLVSRTVTVSEVTTFSFTATGVGGDFDTSGASEFEASGGAGAGAATPFAYAFDMTKDALTIDNVLGNNEFTKMQETDKTIATAMKSVNGWGGCEVKSDAMCAAGSYLDASRACQTCAAGKAVHILSDTVVGALSPFTIQESPNSPGTFVVQNNDALEYRQGAAFLGIPELNAGQTYYAAVPTAAAGQFFGLTRTLTAKSATVTAVTKANPVVVTAANTFSNGETVVFARISGMTEINGLMCTVASASATTFTCSNINSAGFTTYTSGGVATNDGAEVATITGISVNADAVVTAANSFADGDIVRFYGVKGFTDDQSGLSCIVASRTANTFKCGPTGNPATKVNTVGGGAYTGGGLAVKWIKITDPVDPVTGLGSSASGHQFVLKMKRSDSRHTKMTTSMVAPATNTISITGHGWSAGTKVVYQQSVGKPINGLQSGSNYYVQTVTADTFKLANKKVDMQFVHQTSPVSVAATGHGFANGDSVLLYQGASSMTDLTPATGLGCTVQDATTNTFTCDGVDGTKFSAYDTAAATGLGFALGADLTFGGMGADGSEGNSFSIETDACGAWKCPGHMNVAGKACASCPVGKTVAAGGESTSTDTTCSPILCDADYRVEDHRCVPCVAGKTIAALGDASLGDTSCAASGCDGQAGTGYAGLYGKVVDGACAKCDAGTAMVAKSAGATTYPKWTAMKSTRSAWSYTAISFITVTNPVTITATGHSLANNDRVVIFGVAGMIEMNDKLCIVTATTTNTFKCVGFDASANTPYAGGGQALKGTITKIEAKQPAYIEVINTFANGDVVTIKGVSGTANVNDKRCIVAERTVGGFNCQNLNGLAAPGVDFTATLTFTTGGYAVLGSLADDMDTTASQGLDADASDRKCANVQCAANQHSFATDSKCTWCAAGKSTTVGDAAPAAIISRITQTNPPVVTAAGHAFTAGDVVTITGAVGMTDVNYAPTGTITGVSKATDGVITATAHGILAGQIVSISGINGLGATTATITGISQAAEAVVTADHTYAVGQSVKISGVVGMTEINGRFCVIKAVTVATPPAVGLTDFTCDLLDTRASAQFSAYISGGQATTAIINDMLCKAVTVTTDTFTCGTDTTKHNGQYINGGKFEGRTCTVGAPVTKTYAATGLNTWAGATATFRTNKVFTITGISQATSAVVTHAAVPAAMIAAAGDILIFSGVTAVGYNDMPCTVSSPTTTGFTCTGLNTLATAKGYPVKFQKNFFAAAATDGVASAVVVGMQVTLKGFNIYTAINGQTCTVTAVAQRNLANGWGGDITCDTDATKMPFSNDDLIVATVTAGTKAAEAKITAANAYSAGDVLSYSGAPGSWEGVACTVKAGVTATGFICAGLDTSGYTAALTSGSFTKFTGSFEVKTFTCTNHDASYYPAYTGVAGWASIKGKGGVSGADKLDVCTNAGVNGVNGCIWGNQVEGGGYGVGTAKASTECVGDGVCASGTIWNAVPITLTSKTSEVVVTAPGNNFVNGMSVLLTGIVGATQLNGLGCTVAARTADTFTCSNLNCLHPVAGAAVSAAASAVVTGVTIVSTGSAVDNTLVNGDTVIFSGCGGGGDAANLAAFYNGQTCTVASVSETGWTCTGMNTALKLDGTAGAGATGCTAQKYSATNPVGPLSCGLFDGLAGKPNLPIATAAEFGYNQWTAAIGGQYVEERDFTVAEAGATLDWDGLTRQQKAIKKRTCKACPQGKQNPKSDALDGTNIGVAQCTVTLPCPKNHFIDTQGACIACPSNSFRPESLMGGSPSVFKSIGGVSTVAVLTSGHANFANGAAAAAFCMTSCGVDEYLTKDIVDTVANTAVCVACAKGTTRTAGDTLVRTGVTLPPGSALPVEGSYGFPELTTCATVYCPENTAPDGQGGCIACALGMQRTPSSEDMDAASFKLDQAATQTVKTCTAIVCGKDTFNSGAPTFTCTSCPTGQSNPKGDVATSPIAGSCSLPACGLISGVHHKWDAVNAKCVACKIWETSAQATPSNAATATTCVPLSCKVNEYVANDAFHTCTACPTGQTTNAALHSRASPTQCDVTNCAVGEFVNSNDECSKCPVGTTSVVMPRSAENKKLGVSVCTQSGADDFHPLAPCEANFHVVNHQCVACDGGKTNLKGDDPNANVNTYCDDVPASAARLKTSACAANRRVEDHKCVACPVGTTNAEGDDPRYFDTECAAVICSENSHVKCTTGGAKSCVCAACPVLLTNTAGDDCSKGVDTSCV
jgi:hypothetical protein